MSDCNDPREQDPHRALAQDLCDMLMLTPYLRSCQLTFPIDRRCEQCSKLRSLFMYVVARLNAALRGVTHAVQRLCAGAEAILHRVHQGLCLLEELTSRVHRTVLVPDPCDKRANDWSPYRHRFHDYNW